MRFLPQEHSAMVLALEAAGIDPRTVLFVKRRGRLHVELPGHSGAFIFFREKSTKLDAQGQWQEFVFYQVGKGGDGRLSWDEVLVAFTTWLSTPERMLP